MKKMLMVVAALFALCLTTAMAMEELPRKPIEQQRNMENDLCRGGGCGWVNFYNEDWVPLTFNYDQLPTIRMGYGDDTRTPGDMVSEGSLGVLKLPPGEYTLMGDAGDRGSLSFEIQPFHTTNIHFFGVEENGRYAVRMTHDSESNNPMEYRNRAQFELPPPPPPPPPPIHHDGWHDGGGWNGGGDPWYQEPPHRYGPPIQEPPPEPIFRRGPGLQMPPPEQHPYYVPHVRY